MGGDVEEGDFLDVAGEDASLGCGAEGDDFVLVDAFEGLEAEEVFDGVLDEGAATGAIKTAASDPSGIVRVVLAHTDGQGTWQSQDLTYQESMGKWTGTISATTETRYFVQVVDGAGNVALDDAKGRYHSLAPPLPLAQSSLEAIYLPLVLKGG